MSETSMTPEQSVSNQTPRTPRQRRFIRGMLDKVFHPNVSLEQVEKVTDAIRKAENIGFAPPRPPVKTKTEELKPNS